MSTVALAILIVAACSCLYHLVAALCSVFFLLRNKLTIDLNGCHWPKVACLKPLCGYDFETPLNLRSFLDQDYPDYEVICGTADKEDSAYSLARSVCQENTRGNARVVFGEVGAGTNRKVRNLRNIEANIAPDATVLVLSDSDIRVRSDYLKRMVAPIRDDESVGAVTSLYRMENVSGLGALLEALAVESTFAPGVLVAATFSTLRYAFGASIALRRSDFAATGGFSAVENHLADDYQIGNRIHRHGKRVVLSPYVVAIILPKQEVRSTLSHLIRWNRTIRACEPVGYFFSITCHSMLWAALAFAVLGADPMGWMVFGGTGIIRIITAAVVAASLGSRKGIIRALLAPAWDFLTSCLWLIGLGGNTVTWRGVRYRLFADGRITEMHHD